MFSPPISLFCSTLYDFKPLSNPSRSGVTLEEQRVADERMLGVIDNAGIRRILHARNCGAASALQLYRHYSCKESSAGLVMLQDVPKVSLSRTFSFPRVAQTNYRPAEDMGNHDQGQPGTDLRTASPRPRTMEKGLGERAYNLIRIPNLTVIT